MFWYIVLAIQSKWVFGYKPLIIISLHLKTIPTFRPWSTTFAIS